MLVVTPVPKASQADKSKNTIAVNQVGDTLQVTVNGLVDVNQPGNAAGHRPDRGLWVEERRHDHGRSEAVTVPTTLDGGHGGVNLLTAGGGPATEFGWFPKKNVLKGGPANDTLTGRKGFVKFVKSGGNDTLFAGEPNIGRPRPRAPIFPGKIFGAKPKPPPGGHVLQVHRQVPGEDPHGLTGIVPSRGKATERLAPRPNEAAYTNLPNPAP